MTKKKTMIFLAAVCVAAAVIVLLILAGKEAGKKTVLYSEAEKGDTVVFGAYEQDGSAANGKEPVEWIVLDRIDDDLLLLSLNCLDGRTYNEESFVPVTWKDSRIRSWLNREFLENAFTREEQAMIRQTDIMNADQSEYGTSGGKDTKDRVFLLSETDVLIYLYDDLTKATIGRAPATVYAQSHLNYTDEDGMAEWWLRSPGAYEYTAQFVDASGTPYTSGAYVDIVNAVRPAVWLHAAEQ